MVKGKDSGRRQRRNEDHNAVNKHGLPRKKGDLNRRSTHRMRSHMGMTRPKENA